MKSEIIEESDYSNGHVNISVKPGMRKFLKYRILEEESYNSYQDVLENELNYNED